MNWKIWYIDGSTFSSQEGTPQKAPGLGVIVIVVESDDHGWRSVINDYYIWDCRGGYTGWWGVDRAALEEYLFYYTGYKVALMGRMTSNTEFDQIFERAMNDPDFPKKTTFANKERKP